MGTASAGSLRQPPWDPLRPTHVELESQDAGVCGGGLLVALPTATLVGTSGGSQADAQIRWAGETMERAALHPSPIRPRGCLGPPRFAQRAGYAGLGTSGWPDAEPIGYLGRRLADDTELLDTAGLADQRLFDPRPPGPPPAQLRMVLNNDLLEIVKRSTQLGRRALMIVNQYDQKMVDIYDKVHSDTTDAEAAAEYLAGLCPDGGTVLELGIGSGRLAFPLAERGLKVFGIDGSEAMLTELRRRDPHGRIEAELGDFAEVNTGRQYDLITVVLNTFFVLIDSDQQIAALKLAREQLAPGGKFVVEAFDPAPFHAMAEQKTAMRILDDKTVLIESLVVLRDQQLMVMGHVILDGGAPHTTQHIGRYAFPSELDLMAQIAGLTLVGRYDGWGGTPYHASSSRHVSIYQHADT